MKRLFTFFYFFVFLGLSIAQQASDYFPAQTGFEWKYKVTPLDSASNPVTSLAVFRIDSFASVATYEGQLANIVTTKTGPFESIYQQQFSDSLFYYTEATNGFEYLSITNVEEFLITLDELGIASNFSFVDFFTSLQNWYSTYRFTSDVDTEYTIAQKDTTIQIILPIPFQFKYLGTRLQDQTIQTVLGNFENCKKFLLQWKVASASLGGDLLTLNDTIWIAPSNWIVQDIMPGQYVNNPTLTGLGIDPFSIPGLEIKLTDELTTVANDNQMPISILLEQNYPNPFNPNTKIKYSVPELGFVTLKVYDVLGNEIVTLVNEEKPEGKYEVELSGAVLTSGIYFYQLHVGNNIETKKMVLLK